MRRQLKIFLCLAVLDLVGWVLSLGAGLGGRQLVLPQLFGPFQSDVQLRPEYLGLFAIGLAVFAYDGLYAKRHAAWEELRHLLRSVSVTMVLFLAVMTVFKRGADVSRPALVLAWVVAPGVLIGLRMWVKKHVLTRGAFWPRRVMIAGVGAEALLLANHLGNFPELGYQLIGFLGAGDCGGAKGVRVCGSLDDLEEVVSRERVDELILALPGESRLKQFDLLKRAEAIVPDRKSVV